MKFKKNFKIKKLKENKFFLCTFFYVFCQWVEI